MKRRKRVKRKVKIAAVIVLLICIAVSLIIINRTRIQLAFKGYDKDGSFNISEADWSEDNILHLRYANANKMLDYGLYDDTLAGTIDNLTFATEEGWSKLLIQQCYKHDETVDTSL